MSKLDIHEGPTYPATVAILVDPSTSEIVGKIEKDCLMPDGERERRVKYLVVYAADEQKHRQMRNFDAFEEAMLSVFKARGSLLLFTYVPDPGFT